MRWRMPCFGSFATPSYALRLDVRTRTSPTRVEHTNRPRAPMRGSSPRRLPLGGSLGAMKLVETLVARDEADIIDEHIAYHLDAGVDLVIATDHRSRDGTTEILESHARAGVLRLIRAESEFASQRTWQTRMSRLAATEFGADWVINSDADEFWWPRGASLKEVLDAVPSQYGVVQGLVRNFVPSRDDNGWFAERMTVRLAAHAPINDPATPFRPVVKIAHRGHPEARMGQGGAHQVFGIPGSLLRAWQPIEILHLPLRSREQCARKYERTWTGWERNLRGDLARARQTTEKGKGDAMWDRLALAEAEIDRGLADGSLVSDTRLRDALRALRGDDELERVIPRRTELDAHALEAAVFEEAEVVRLRRWVDDLEQLAVALEDRTSSGAHRLPGR